MSEYVIIYKQNCGAKYGCIATIKNDVEYNRINKEVIPSIMHELYKILEG